LTSETFDRVVRLVARGEVVISEHGYDEVAADGILIRDVLAGVTEGKVVEDYPQYYEAPACWFCSETTRASPYTWCGASRARRSLQRLWSRLIVPTPLAGQRIS